MSIWQIWLATKSMISSDKPVASVGAGIGSGRSVITGNHVGGDAIIGDKTTHTNYGNSAIVLGVIGVAAIAYGTYLYRNEISEAIGIKKSEDNIPK
ncbi:MAG: hypothetical protein Q7V63_08855 [Gammaproteobacteria bacterium]|nr:hypothetical protein [Gammaproteobacteria bacterium]